MRLILLSVAAVAMLSTNLHAAACTPGSLSSYIALGAVGCSVGEFQFSHFDYLVAITNVNSNNVGPNDITVNPNVGAGGPEVDFTADWHTNNNILPASYTATLMFRIESLQPFDRALSANTLDLTGGLTGLVTAATVAEVNCLGGLLDGGSLCLGGGITAGLSAGLSLGNANASAALLYNPPVTLVDVIKNITLTSTGSLLASSASLSSIGQSFTATSVPEPGAGLMFLLGSGAIFVLLAKTRRSAAAGGGEKTK